MNNFFSKLYEVLFRSGTFSDDLYQEGLYSQLGFIALFSAGLLAVFFYYILNRPSFSRWYHWLVIMGVCFVINYILGVIIPRSRFSSLNISYGSEYWVFALFNGIIACLFFTVVSFTIRWWSRNCKGTPIPN
ncbi:MAG: hypothetical protein NTW29_17030 [Bacteroidetes bacterium]|nr:hypothetical protein [Bacteroidota bacterium]